MFGFGKNNNPWLRDEIISLISDLLERDLLPKGYKEFSSFYIRIHNGNSASSGNSPFHPGSIFSFKITDIDGHILLMDNVIMSMTGIERDVTIDLYLMMVHKYLKNNFKEYREARYSDNRLS